jgi:hypothetical protein
MYNDVASLYFTSLHFLGVTYTGVVTDLTTTVFRITDFIENLEHF